MPTASNLYAEKVFAEHPLVLWALDDKADFVNLLTLAEQDFTSNWTATGGSIQSASTQDQGGIISDAPTSQFVSTTSSTTVALSSGNIESFANLDPLKNTFSISFYFKSTSALINNLKVGYEYGSTQETKTFDIDLDNQWVFISETFDVPSSAESFRVLIDINFSQSTPGTEQQFYINGLSVGQWSENSSFSSAGVQPQALPSDINLPEGIQAIPAKAYGLTDTDGYYLVANNALRSYNDGFPMVYGATGVTKIFPNKELPSVIFPGNGFLNDVGQYREYTAEMWLRINSSATGARRIFGPINSDDGLYVDGSFLVFKIGENVSSHFVREWHRPMLLHIRVVNNAVSLLVNGEQVISQIIDTNALQLPSRASQTGLSNDWLGFYGHSDVPMIELDCFALYSYQVPEVVAKRRFVYGQGVEFPENINTSFSGESAFVDYRFAKYSNNYLYPDMGRWEQGTTENIKNENNVISGPDLELPDVVLENNEDVDQWIIDSELAFEASSEAYSFLDFSQKQGYLLFDEINVTQQSTEAIYGVFKTNSTDEQILFKIEDKSNNNYLAAKVAGSTISYVFKYGGQAEKTLYSVDSHTAGIFFNVGINFNAFASISSNVSAFLGNRTRLRVYVAGQPGFGNGFKGNLYRFGFATQRNLAKISTLFADNGVALNQDDIFDIGATTDGGSPTSTFTLTTDGGAPDTTAFTDDLDGGEPFSTARLSFVSHVASYTLIPKYYLGSFRLDVGCDSYWQDYLPLKYFAKFVETQDGDSRYGLDFLQINLGYPKLERINSSSQYVTSDLPIRTFVSFQYLASGANNSDQYYVNTNPAPSTGVVVPGTEWLNTKYEITDDTVVYIPQNVDFNQIAVVFHIQFVSDGIFTNNFKLKSLQIAGQALSYHNPTPVGTRFGSDIIPYYMRGVYKDYKTSNPFSIYKGSSPYLYLTSNTGIRLRGDKDSIENRALEFPVNLNRSSTYRLGAAQLAYRYSDKLFPSSKKKLFEVEGTNTKIIFYLEPANSERTRARIYAIDFATQLPVQGLSYYLNGKRVKEPYILAEEWNMLGIQFLNALNMDGYAGAIRLVGPGLINNVASYQLSATQQATSTIFRTWAQVPNMLDKEDDPATTEIDESVTYWGDFVSEEYLTSWGEVLFIPVVKSYSLDPKVIYTAYTGTNKSIVDNPKVLRFGDYSYSFYKDINWQSTIREAV